MSEVAVKLKPVELAEKQGITGLIVSRSIFRQKPLFDIAGWLERCSTEVTVFLDQDKNIKIILGKWRQAALTAYKGSAEDAVAAVVASGEYRLLPQLRALARKITLEDECIPHESWPVLDKMIERLEKGRGYVELMEHAAEYDDEEFYVKDVDRVHKKQYEAWVNLMSHVQNAWSAARSIAEYEINHGDEDWWGDPDKRAHVIDAMETMYRNVARLYSDLCHSVTDYEEDREKYCLSPITRKIVAETVYEFGGAIKNRGSRTRARTYFIEDSRGVIHLVSNYGERADFVWPSIVDFVTRLRSEKMDEELRRGLVSTLVKLADISSMETAIQHYDLYMTSAEETAERLGAKPEDLARFGLAGGYEHAVNYDAFAVRNFAEIYMEAEKGEPVESTVSEVPEIPASEAGEGLGRLEEEAGGVGEENVEA